MPWTHPHRAVRRRSRGWLSSPPSGGGWHRDRNKRRYERSWAVSRSVPGPASHVDQVPTVYSFHSARASCNDAHPLETCVRPRIYPFMGKTEVMLNVKEMMMVSKTATVSA